MYSILYLGMESTKIDMGEPNSLLIKYSKYPSTISKVRVQKLTSHSHMECAN